MHAHLDPVDGRVLLHDLQRGLLSDRQAIVVCSGDVAPTRRAVHKTVGHLEQRRDLRFRSYTIFHGCCVYCRWRWRRRSQSVAAVVAISRRTLPPPRHGCRHVSIGRLHPFSSPRCILQYIICTQSRSAILCSRLSSSREHLRLFRSRIGDVEGIDSLTEVRYSRGYW